MTLDEMFEAATDEFLKFDRIENPRHPAPDICAFLMLYDLVPTIGARSGKPVDVVACAEHDEIYLATDCDMLAKVATPEIIRDLHRCGVRYSEEYDSLCMFV
ncbi:MAG: hypothetical protein JWR07_1932 [Nevskia sp.]|nr:hypothetical protein [Nevskia sp.]